MDADLAAPLSWTRMSLQLRLGGSARLGGNGLLFSQFHRDRFSDVHLLHDLVAMGCSRGCGVRRGSVLLLSFWHFTLSRMFRDILAMRTTSLMHGLTSGSWSDVVWR